MLDDHLPNLSYVKLSYPEGLDLRQEVSFPRHYNKLAPAP